MNYVVNNGIKYPPGVLSTASRPFLFPPDLLHVTDKVNVLQFFQSIHEELNQEEPEKRISFQKRVEI